MINIPLEIPAQKFIASFWFKVILIFLVGFTLLSGQNELKIQDVKLDPEGIVSKRDANGDYCAAIRVISEMNGFRYTSYNGIVAVEHLPGEDIVYLSANERVLKIYLSGYLPKKVILSEYDIHLQQKEIWELKVSGEKQPQKIPITIRTEPEDASIYIDGEKYSSVQSTNITKGEHSLKLVRPGYKTLTKNISINDSTTYFEYELEKLKPVINTIKSIPQDARIYIDNVQKGFTNKQFFLMPGHYKVRLTKNGYRAINDSINIIPGQENNFTYYLTKTSTRIIVRTEPTKANIYLNNEKQSSDSISVAPGKYEIKVQSSGYYPKSDIIEVEQDQNRVLNYQLTPRTGTLKFQVKPVDASVLLKNKDRVVDGWTGSKYYDNLPIGDYTIKIFSDNYKNRTIEIDIKENSTRSLNINLQKTDTNRSKGQKHYSKFIYLEGDTFTMGDTWGEGNRNEKPPHKVFVDDMYISKYEVTHAEYLTFLNNAGIPKDFIYKGNLLLDPDKNWSTIGYENGDFYFKGSKYAQKINTPVLGVTFFGALAYCNWKSRQEGLETVYTITNNHIKYNKNANGYRLPTEAEWEYAAKMSDSITRFSGTDQKEKLKKYAWYKNNANSQSHPIGTKQPNSQGLYDLNGNVFEWCWDKYRTDYYSYSPINNPIGPRTGKGRILRGGSWRTHSYYCRNTNRYLNNPSYSQPDNGFRTVRSPKEK